MTSWFERRDDVDHYSPADLDEMTEQLLTLARPVRGPRPVVCRNCLVEVTPGEACDSCGRVPHEGRRAA